MFLSVLVLSVIILPNATYYKIILCLRCGIRRNKTSDDAEHIAARSDARKPEVLLIFQTAKFVLIPFFPF